MSVKAKRSNAKHSAFLWVFWGYIKPDRANQPSSRLTIEASYSQLHPSISIKIQHLIFPSKSVTLKPKWWSNQTDRHTWTRYDTHNKLLSKRQHIEPYKTSWQRPIHLPHSLILMINHREQCQEHLICCLEYHTAHCIKYKNTKARKK